MSLYNKMKTSPKLENDGVELEIGRSAKVIVARAGGSNQQYNMLAEQIARKHKRAIDNDLLSSDQGRKLLYELYAEAVVKNWFVDDTPDAPEPTWKAGVELPNGDIGEVTFDNIMLTFREMPDVFLMIKETAENLQFYRQALIAGVVKN